MALRILTFNPNTGEQGIYIEGEIGGLPEPLWVNKSEFPAVGGGSEAQKIARLEADIATLLDSKMPPATSQRVRVHIFSLVPLEYMLGVFASPADIGVNWWGG